MLKFFICRTCGNMIEIVKTKGVVGKGTLSIKSLLGTEEIEFEVKKYEEKQ